MKKENISWFREIGDKPVLSSLPSADEFAEGTAK